jgi:hypothetical protein
LYSRARNESMKRNCEHHHKPHAQYKLLPQRVNPTLKAIAATHSYSSTNTKCSSNCNTATASANSTPAALASVVLARRTG